MGTLRTLRAKPLETFFFALLAVGSLWPTVCLVGLILSLPAFAVLVGRLLDGAERAADDVPGRVHSTQFLAAGAPALVFVAATLIVTGASAGGVGIALTEAYARLPSWGPVVCGLTGVAAAVLLAVFFAPLAFVPFAAADRQLGVIASVVRGLEIAARDRRVALSRTAALAALVLVGPPTVLAVVDVYANGDEILGIAVCALLVPCLAVSTAMIATRYVAVRRNAPPPDAARRLAPTLRASFAVMPVAALLIVGATGWAMATPSLAPAEHDVRETEVVPLSTSDDATIPHTFVRVRAVWRGILISTPDGGGAGVVRCADPRDGLGTPQRVVVERSTDDLVLHVITQSGAQSYGCVVRVSRSGVRLDDDLLDRLARGSWLFPLGVWLALFGFLWLVSDAVRHAIDSRVLAAADLSRDDAGGGLRALEGVVAGSSASRFLEVGELRFALPRRRAFPDGATITVMARFKGPLGVGQREAARPLPRGARVVLGGADAARAFLVELASRSAIVATLIVIAGSVFAAVSLIVALWSGA